MHLKEITIENFKGIKGPLSIQIKPITLLFGANSSGKSSIIQAINYSRDIFTSGGIVDPEKQNTKNKNIGNYQNITNHHDLNKPISFEFLVKFDQVDEFLGFVSDNINTRFTVSKDTGFYKKISNISNLVFSEIQYIIMEVKLISLKITILWNQKKNQPEIQRIFVKANDLPLYTIGRDIEIRPTKTYMPSGLMDPDSIKLSFYNHPILTEKVISTVLKRHSEILNDIIFSADLNKEQYQEIKKSINEEYNDFKENNTPHTIIFTAILNQPAIFPDHNHQILFHNRSDSQFWATADGLEEKKNFYINLFSALVTTPINTITHLFSDYEHIGPLREMPPRNLIPEKDPKSFCWSTGLAAYDVLQHPSTTKGFIDELNKWLLNEDHLNTGYSIELKRYFLVNEQSLLGKDIDALGAIQDIEKIKEIIKDELMKKRKIEFKIKDKNSTIELLPQDVGTGISQILPIVVGSLWLQNKTIAIEQPELHIHPAMQAEMGDLFIKASNYNKENNYYSHLEAVSAKHSLMFLDSIKKDGYKDNEDRIETIDTGIAESHAKIAKYNQRELSNSFILETHSEHLILRLMRRIRETADQENEKNVFLSPEDIAVYYMKNGKNGVKATHITINEQGDFDSLWPDGFFSERSKELF